MKWIKKFIPVFLIIIMIIALLPSKVVFGSAAATVTPTPKPTSESKFEYSITKDNTVQITGFTGTDKTVIIPSKIKGKKVTGIGSYTFYENTNVTKITIPSGVTDIGEYTFNQCKNLKTINIPKTVINFGRNTFVGTKWLDGKLAKNQFVTANNCLIYADQTIEGDIMIPKDTKVISTGVFSGMNITSVAIPASVTSIQDYAFSQCLTLTSIKFATGSKLENIGMFAFEDCDKLETIKFPKNLTKFREGAFSGTLWLENMQKQNPFVIVNNILIDGSEAKGKVTIPNGVTTIGSHAFAGCGYITSITFPKGVTRIEDGAFKMCVGLTKITLPDTITYIGGGAFSNCMNLKSVVLPNKINKIEALTFVECEKLNNIEIPKTVTEIGDWAFMGCFSLEKVKITSSNVKIGVSAFSGAPWGKTSEAKKYLMVS